MSKTTYAETLVLDYLLTAVAVTRPTNWYLAIHTADPTETGEVAELTPGSNGYNRQAIAFDDSAQPYVNTDEIVFGPCTSVNWGEIVGWSIKDAATAGNTLYKGTFTTSRTIEISDEAKVAAGDITIDED